MTTFAEKLADKTEEIRHIGDYFLALTEEVEGAIGGEHMESEFLREKELKALLEAFRACAKYSKSLKGE